MFPVSSGILVSGCEWTISMGGIVNEACMFYGNEDITSFRLRSGEDKQIDGLTEEIDRFIKFFRQWFPSKAAQIHAWFSTRKETLDATLRITLLA